MCSPGRLPKINKVNQKPKGEQKKLLSTEVLQPQASFTWFSCQKRVLGRQTRFRTRGVDGGSPGCHSGSRQHPQKGAMICLRVWVGGKADSSKPRKIVLGRGGTYHMNQD